jgi:hypothetical protein
MNGSEEMQPAMTTPANVRSVDALYAVYKTGLLEVLEGAEYGHPIELKEKVRQLTMG